MKKKISSNSIKQHAIVNYIYPLICSKQRLKVGLKRQRVHVFQWNVLEKIY